MFKIIKRIKLFMLLREIAARDTDYKLRQQILDILSLLDIKDFRKYDPESAMGVVFSSMYASLAELTLGLENINLVLDKGGAVSREVVQGRKLRKLDLDEFITLDSNNYCDPVDNIKRFKNALGTFCKLMAESDTAEWGEPEHNLRILKSSMLEFKEILLVILRFML